LSPKTINYKGAIFKFVYKNEDWTPGNIQFEFTWVCFSHSWTLNFLSMVLEISITLCSGRFESWT